MNNHRTLLIIDDEVDVCLLLRRALQKRFYKVECAHSLADGVFASVALQPDVILLDNNLPDGFGIEHIARFKNESKMVHIVMISAMDIQQEAMLAGADAFLSKPVDLKALDIIN